MLCLKMDMRPLFKGHKIQGAQSRFTTQGAILPQTPNHRPYTNQEAEKYKEPSNLTNKLVSTVIAQQCEDIAF